MPLSRKVSSPQIQSLYISVLHTLQDNARRIVLINRVVGILSFIIPKSLDITPEFLLFIPHLHCRSSNPHSLGIQLTRLNNTPRHLSVARQQKRHSLISLINTLLEFRTRWRGGCGSRDVDWTALAVVVVRCSWVGGGRCEDGFSDEGLADG